MEWDASDRMKKLENEEERRHEEGKPLDKFQSEERMKKTTPKTNEEMKKRAVVMMIIIVETIIRKIMSAMMMQRVDRVLFLQIKRAQNH